MLPQRRLDAVQEVEGSRYLGPRISGETIRIVASARGCCSTLTGCLSAIAARLTAGHEARVGHGRRAVPATGPGAGTFIEPRNNMVTAGVLRGPTQ